MKRLFVTGGNGFVGQWVQRLAPAIAQRHGLSVQVAERGFDLLEPAQVDAAIAQARPDAVLHLAARSNIPAAFRDPAGTLRANLFGTLGLFEGLKRASLFPRVLYASSGDIYGLVPEAEMPIAESRLPRPRNPYAVSKVAAEALCHQWTRTEGLPIVVARPFNHVGAGQSDTFVLPSIARQVALAEAGRQPPFVEVGDVDVVRDFLHVADVIEAYLVLLAHGDPGEIYNICSGDGKLVRSLAEGLIALGRVKMALRQDAARRRPAEQRVARGDNARLRALGWAPSGPVERVLPEILEDWRARTAVA